MNAVTRVREDDVDTFDGLAVVDVCVGDEWLGTSQSRTTTLNGDDGAVHVHFAVALVIEPTPCKERFTGWCRGRDRDVHRQRIGHATADVRVNDVPACALIIRERELTRTTAVNGGTGQAYVDGLTSGPGDDRVHRGTSRWRVDKTLAWVRTIRDQRRSHRVVLERFGGCWVEL